MANEIISYLEMCQREGVSLQRGMNFAIGRGHSVILMSLRPNAPYEDVIQEGGKVLIYEGHDAPRSAHVLDPKRVDQPEKKLRRIAKPERSLLRGSTPDKGSHPATRACAGV